MIRPNAPAADNAVKPLPIFCCNGSSCQSEEPGFLKRESFVQTPSIKYTETMREWIACRIATLKEWRKAKSKALWLKDGVEEPMPDTLLMSEQCFLDLAKQREEFNEKDKLADFLRPWPDLDEFVDEIFDCLQGSSPQGQDPPTKAQRKSILKAGRASKKAKFMDDPTVT